MSKSTKKVNFSGKCIAKMSEQYNSGSSFLDIAKNYGCAKNTIRKYLLLNGIETNRKRSISVKSKGRVSPRKGAILSAETRKKISEASKGNTRCIGRKCSEASIQKMREAFYRNKDYRMSLLKKASLIANEKRRLPKEERLLHNKQRTKYKNCIRRFIRATGKKKCSKTEIMVGYSQTDFVRHIESQFKEGMSWSDRESFHVDHKIPVAEFFRRGITDPKIINALENLQPLFPQENRIKSDKLLTAFPDLLTIEP